jgi:predicted outer membrane repeat protein
MAIVTVTNTSDNGEGSLREALANAQSGDTIKFASGLANKKITLTSGDIDVLKAVNIDGSDAPNLTISGNDKSRIFNIGNRQNRINVTIKNLSFTDGRAVAGTLDDKNFGDGGAIRIHDFSDLVVEDSTFKNNVAERGGAIRVNYGGSLTVRNSTFDGNDGSIANDGFSAGAIATHGSGGEADFDPGNGFLTIEGSTFTNNKGNVGGAVYSLLGPLKIENSVFKKNESTHDGGAIFTDGADKSPKDGKGGNVIIRNTVVEGNTAKGQGGGLFLWNYESDKVLIEDSTIVGNSTTYGGIYNDSKGGGMRVANGELIIRNSTIANNTTDKQGGGLWIDSDKSIIIENSTFSGNKVKNDQGGAITFNTPEGTPVKITNTTFANNSAGRDAGAIWSHGGNSDDIILTNTIFAGNTADKTKQGNTNFQLKDGGGNFVENTLGGRGPEVTVTATYVDDLKLGDLQKVGDSLIHVLASDSPAINAGTTKGATKTDQRGVGRGSNPDVGAFEFVSNTSNQSTGSNPSPATPQQPPTSESAIRYEAQQLDLKGYEVESVHNSGASGGKYISLRDTDTTSGTAKGTFNGKAGTYQVKVGYYDENDGVSSATVTVDGQSKSFKFDRDLPSNYAHSDAKTSRTTHSAIELKPGDRFEIQGKADGGEFARFDYIEFIKVKNDKEVMTPVDSPITSQKPLIDLREIDLNNDGKVDSKVSVTFDNIRNNSSFNNRVGFYKVANADGAVLVNPGSDELILPGQAGYTQAALKQRVSDINLNQGTGKFTTELQGGALYAPYLITTEQVSGDNSQLYFNYGAANPDKMSHVKLVGENQFGFEDKFGGGDRDFNDFTFKVKVQNA